MLKCQPATEITEKLKKLQKNVVPVQDHEQLHSRKSSANYECSYC